MTQQLSIHLNRQSAHSLTDQISDAIRSAIHERRLQPGAKLASWNDLAAQLGVARGTVRGAYERLIDEQLVVAIGAAGTRVARAPSVPLPLVAETRAPERGTARQISAAPSLAFRMGVPAQDAFPGKLWARIMARHARTGSGSAAYPDPCGESSLRAQIALQLSITRGIQCAPDAVFITNGYRGALGVALRCIGAHGQSCWVEDPGYPPTRQALKLEGARAVCVPVDADGMMVESGKTMDADAVAAIVTPGQQAPLGMPMSSERRESLCEWATRGARWIIEDDYLGELQLEGRARPALASTGARERVIHIGTFSKTMYPGLRLGFIVASAALEQSMRELVATLMPAPPAYGQNVLAEFISEGHYLRHLRRMKRLYLHRRRLLCLHLQQAGNVVSEAGLALLVETRAGLRDTEALRHAAAAGLAPSALSRWYADPATARHGLLLGVANLLDEVASEHCAVLQPVLLRRTD